ncbi:hypothetical protein [Natrialbaceae archaeon AArc-T1-2]|uniref:hypothetical protein n=1 Tax=Natrialbaceae archaeon AArc-T1-2 TaxID=3053904 RepID=UPI00255AEF46|nr:hypothetical protein [Natrialbaceae archaeon AArc-T1-2]WIV65643.1 hypothetical protein QQ977_07975 [Natrialbaceae archaeon AArc-T1-2]
MLNPVRVDAAVDLAYGALIVLAIVLIATLEFGIGIAFGLGVFSAYVVHVVWKMARFDPDWMTQAVEETVEETVEKTVGETVEKQVEGVQAQVEAVEERVDRRPREDEVEEIIEESVGDESES